MKPPRAVRIKIPSWRKKKGKTRKKPRELETPIHEAIYRRLCAILLPGSMIHHSPNEIGVALEREHRMAVIGKWKRLGMRPGWPDLEAIAVQSDGTWRLIMIEVKSDEGTLSQAQKDVRRDFKAIGVLYCICRSVQDVEEFLRWEGVETRLAA